MPTCGLYVSFVLGAAACLFGALGAVLPASGAPALSVVESPDALVVDTGSMRFGLGRGSDATLRWMEKDGRRLVETNGAPLLSARLMESAVYDGRTDFVPDRRFIPAAYTVAAVDHVIDDQCFTATLTGTLRFDDDDRFPFTIRLRAPAGASHLEIDVRLTVQGTFRNRTLRDVVVRLPLALDWRKRVAQGGDQGLVWDTRYYYEFPGRGGILPHPDRNAFRYFAVEQDAPHHFRIWRAEGATTPELIHQHGVAAAGWSSVYDRFGGLLFALRDMAETAPKTLEVDAQGGGEARVLLYPESAPALNLADAERAAAVFGRWHSTSWIAYRGEHPEAAPEVLLAELWERDAPLHGARPTGPKDLWDADLELWTEPPAVDAAGPYVCGGIPLPRGRMRAGTPVALSGPGGEVPVQTRPLAFWPDGSVKWLHLVFAMHGGQPVGEKGDVDPDAEGGTESFEVTRRDGGRSVFVLRYGTGVTPARPPVPVTAHAVPSSAETGGVTRVSLDTGPLRIDLALGERWFPAARVHGRNAWRPESGGATAFVDFLRTEEPYPARTTHPAGTADPGPVVIEAIHIEEAGPLRAVVRLRGRAMSREPTDVILRLECYAGRPWVRLTHSVEFTRHDPRRAFLSGMGLRFPVAVTAETAVVTAGGEAGPVTLSADEAVGLRQSSAMQYRLLRGTRAGMRQVEARRRSRGWLDVRDARQGVTLALREMWQSAPKELSFTPQRGELTAWLWPAGGRVMDVRRYSNYPHNAQGESASGHNQWVADHYYGGEGAPNDPFAGTSRTHELLILFGAGDDDVTTAAAVNADFQSPPLVYSGYERYRQTGITVPLPDVERFPGLVQNMQRFSEFWLFHQRYGAWYGLWNYGDFQHRFRGGGYGWKIAPERLAAYVRTPPEERARFREHGELVLDYYPSQDWLFDNGRWGWTNTEGLPGLYFQQEYLRTGRRDIFFAAEALARHARDVVTRHSGRYFGKGTRHGVQHWSDGNHEERQTTFAEYRLHYYLTGEARSREVMYKLSDYYARGRVRRADHSGRIYGLFTRWEMSGEAAFGNLLRDYLHAMVVPEGFAGYADLQLTDDGVRVNDLQAGVNTPSMFFHNFGALHGVVEYCRATGDAEVRDALVRCARAMLPPGAGLQQGSASLGLLAGFAALHDREDARLRDVIVKDMSDPGTGSRDAFCMVLPDPRHWTGETARLSRQVPVCWFYMVSLPVAMAAAGEEPVLPRRIQDRFDAENERARPVEERKPFYPRPSWQEEYDAPELESYFAPWRPRGATTP